MNTVAAAGNKYHDDVIARFETGYAGPDFANDGG
jgi:hypothetical protein